MRKLTLSVLVLLLVLAGSFSTLPPSQAQTKDCDVIAALCRLASRIDYDICLLQGGDPAHCAWKEAEQTINCLRTAGCMDLPKLPPDN